MMASWDGFTDADLKQIKGSGEPQHATGSLSKGKISSLGQTGLRSKTSATAAARAKKSAAAAIAARSAGGSPGEGGVDGTQKKRTSSHAPISSSRQNASGVKPSRTGSLSGTESAASTDSPPPTVAVATYSAEAAQTELPDVRLCTEDEVQHLKKTRLDELHEQQKKLEKINLEKKVKLQQTIVQRTQQAQEETERLALAQKELSRLDNIVSSDVSILREKIEEATAAFNEARRRYDAAEAEFVSSKLHLHRCTEQKELLMEHLITIIEQTELRKANKLAEVLGSLETSEAKEIRSDATTAPPADSATSEAIGTLEAQSPDVEEEEMSDSEPAPVTLLGLSQNADTEGGDVTPVVEDEENSGVVFKGDGE